MPPYPCRIWIRNLCGSWRSPIELLHRKRRIGFDLETFRCASGTIRPTESMLASLAQELRILSPSGR